MTESINFLDPTVLAGLGNLELRARVVVEGFLAGLHKSPHRGFSVEFNDYRHYQRGDDMRHVDWKLYARSDQLYIKQYEDETNVRCVIVLDTSTSMRYASGGVSKLEYGVTLASALAWFIMRQRDAVGLVTFDEQIRDHIPPRCRQPHLMRILRTLAGFTEQAITKTKTQADTKTITGTDATKPLADLAATMSKKSMVILITDMLDDEQRVIGMLQNLRSMGNDVLMFQIMDDAELNFPFSEASEFIDMESRETYITSPAAIRKAYLANLNEFLDYCKKQCQSSGVEYCLMNTSKPLDQALSAYMTKRARSF
ncbi:MAG: DUF58 domain-containing protein [Pseudohongiellaceae bacterium]